MNNVIDENLLAIAEDNGPASTQYITFEILGYLFAIPSRDILRIVQTPPPNQGGLISMGMVQLGPYSIEMIDLVSLLALEGARQPQVTRPSVGSSRALEQRKKQKENDQNGKDQNDHNPPFLVVLQGEGGDLYGIALHEPPDLMDVPDYALKPVPANQRRSQALHWVSHIVNYDLERDRHSLLILDLVRVLNREIAVPLADVDMKFMEILPPLDPPSPASQA